MNQTEDLMSAETRTTFPELDALALNKEKWARMTPENRLHYLKCIEARLQQMDHESWGKDTAASLGYNPAHPAGDPVVAVESMVNAGICLGTVRHLIRTVSSQAKTGQRPSLPTMIRDGREVVQVFPFDQADKFSLEGMSGCTGEVWLQPGQALNAEVTVESQGRLCLVLGAGNQSFLSFGDVMYQLFVEGMVCVLKHHPLRAFGATYFDQIFADLIEDGFFFAYQGGIEESQSLIHHPLVNQVHITGGTATHDAIVWGENAEDQQRNKSQNTPILNKPISSELGCVTPWLVVPGAEWTGEEIDHMAGHLVAAFTSQNSCNCLAPKVVVLDSKWPQRHQFIDAVRALLCKSATLPPHYTGTAKRYQGFVDAYPESQLERIHTPAHPGMSDHGMGPSLPWLLIHMDENSSDYALQNEAFAPVLAFLTIDTANDTKQFLDRAVPFVNESVWGSLSCTLIAHPDLDSSLNGPVEQAIAELRYGSVGVNTWTAAVYGMSGLTWGAYPGETLENVASGQGFVRNAYMLQGVEKSILRSPFQAKNQVVIGPNGRPSTTPNQVRAVRKMLVKPGIGSMLKLIREMVRKPNPSPEEQGLMKRRVRWPFTWFEAMLHRAERFVNWRAKAEFDHTKSHFFRGNFQPAHIEHQALPLEIDGNLPEDLNGTFLRIGPNMKHTPKGVYHLFDGDGMLHAVRLGNGQASYSNRWVQTHKLDVEDTFQRNTFVNIGEMKGGLGLAKILFHELRMQFRIIRRQQGAGRANTSIIHHAGKLLALHEGDAPYEMTLTNDGKIETKGYLDFNGALNSPFTAHPKIDPRTGELLFFGYDIKAKPYCKVGALNANGELSHLFPVDLERPRMMHDCAFTERFFILVSPPLIFQPKEMVTEKKPPISMDFDEPLLMGLIPRTDDHADNIRWFELPAAGIFHVLNAWEEENKCVVYACLTPSINLTDFAPVGDLELSEDGASQLYRFELDLDSGEATQTPITPKGRSLDFPIINPARAGQRSRYGYLTCLTDDVRMESIIKVDLTANGETSIVAEHDFGPNCYGGECTFVARENAVDEDDGYLLVHVRNESLGRSYVDVLDARTLAKDPIARIQIPTRVPYGFHAGWMPAN